MLVSDGGSAFKQMFNCRNRRRVWESRLYCNASQRGYNRFSPSREGDSNIKEKVESVRMFIRLSF